MRARSRHIEPHRKTAVCCSRDHLMQSGGTTDQRINTGIGCGLTPPLTNFISSAVKACGVSVPTRVSCNSHGNFMFLIS
jgi:hypothetical protein